MVNGHPCKHFHVYVSLDEHGFGMSQTALADPLYLSNNSLLDFELFQMIFLKVHVHQFYASVASGWEEGRGWGEEEGGKTTLGHYGTPLGGHTQSHQATRPRRHHSGHGNSYGLLMPNWCAPQVPMCQSWLYRVINHPPEKQTL